MDSYYIHYIFISTKMRKIIYLEISLAFHRTWSGKPFSLPGVDAHSNFSMFIF
jgi:hypothetical protein